MIAAVEDHHLVLLRAAEELIPTALTRAFNQDFVDLTLAAAVGFRTLAVLQGYEFFQALYLYGLRNVVRQMLARVGARALTIFEHKSTVVAHFFHQAQTLLMVFRRLRAVTYEDVSRQTAFGHYPTNSGHAIQIPLACIFAVH